LSVRWWLPPAAEAALQRFRSHVQQLILISERKIECKSGHLLTTKSVLGNAYDQRERYDRSNDR
jgi:hypothetical protein